jgi:hypothetical protein
LIKIATWAKAVSIVFVFPVHRSVLLMEEAYQLSALRELTRFARNVRSAMVARVKGPEADDGGDENEALF